MDDGTDDKKRLTRYRQISERLQNDWEETEQDREKERQSLTRSVLVWSRLIEIYGSKWTSNYGSHPSKMWIEAIARLSDAEIKLGLQKLASKDSPWVVNLGQFQAACREGSDVISWCKYPAFADGPHGRGLYGLPELTEEQQEIYKAGTYLNVIEHRSWITNSSGHVTQSQPWFNASSRKSPETQALEACHAEMAGKYEEAY